MHSLPAGGIGKRLLPIFCVKPCLVAPRTQLSFLQLCNFLPQVVIHFEAYLRIFCHCIPYKSNRTEGIWIILNHAKVFRN